MTLNNPIDTENKSLKKDKLINLAKDCKTDNQKVNFFDCHQESFCYFLNDSVFSSIENVPKVIDDAFYVYANMKKMTEEELHELMKINWKQYPRNFKVFLFDFCIYNSNFD